MALTWAAKATTYAAYYAAAAPLDGYMHRWGGYSSAAVATHQRYDPVANTWSATTTGQNYPVATYAHSAVSTGNHIYSFGGYTGVHTAAFYRYTEAGGWVSMGNMPITSTYGAAAWDGSDYIYLVAGYSGAAYTSLLYRYSISGNTWAQMASGPTIMGFSSAQFYNGALYVYGGYDGAAYVNFFYKYTPSGNAWTTLTANTASDHKGQVSTALGRDRLYAFAAYNGTAQSNQVWSTDLDSISWTQETSLPEAKRLLFAGSWQAPGSSKIYLMSAGGYVGTASGTNTVHVAEAITNTAPSTPVLTAPNGGEIISGAYEILWNNSTDPEGDLVTYEVELSTDGGTTWRVLATGVTGGDDIIMF